VVSAPWSPEACHLAALLALDGNGAVGPIRVVLADDNLIVREGVRALLDRDTTIEVVGVAADYDELLDTAVRLAPQVVVTDIRMPPTYHDEGIRAASEVRKRLPGTGVVVLSQYDSPEYAIELLSAGSDGYAYLLKDRVGDADRLRNAIYAVASGGSMLDPEIVRALVSPAQADGVLTSEQETLLHRLAEGRPVKAIAAALDCPAEAVDAQIEELFLCLARGATAGQRCAVRRLRMLHTAILEREELGQTLSRMLPSGLADRLRKDRTAVDRTERLTVTVLMSDVRGYTGISESSDPAVLAGQLGAHRDQMSAAILSEGGTVMHYIGDAVLAVFGVPDPHPEHAGRAVRAALAMHGSQRDLDAKWSTDGLAPFGLGIGISSGEVAAALISGGDHVQYTVVGDTVNLAQRLQDLARPAGNTVVSEATVRAAGDDWHWEPLGARDVKGRSAPVLAYRLADTASIR
jgi:class 3 adenylate cyclase/DNA-binding NarL/FixJ family response regulator